MAEGENIHAALSQTIETTMKMLTYAARRGAKVERADIDSVVATARAVRENTLTREQESAFWSSAASISRAIAPVTLESLEASIPQTRGYRNTTLAASAAKRYRVRTIVTLVALLLFQIYWLVGATVITDIKEIRTRLEQMAVERISLMRTRDLLTKVPSLEDDPARAKQAAQLADDPARAKNAAELEDLSNRIWVERISASTSFDVLKNWNVAKWLLLWRTGTQTPTVAPTAISSTETTTRSRDDYTIRPTDRFLWIFTPENVAEMQTAQITLTALLKYILPILYGALGASAYIVRILANEIRDATYSIGSNVRYQLRFYLGAVAGFSIAWLTSEAKPTENVGLLQSLSPLALAFLAGYSVDLLFSLLDRMVLAFSGPEPRPTSQSNN
jgi:urease accessory protein UreF